MEQKGLIKIVAIGPESTGKSTLCESLAKHYNTQWCPEYAREHLLKHGMNYSYDDLLYIAKKQLELEDNYAKSLVVSSGSGVNSKLQTPNFSSSTPTCM
jgi:nicotinamide riboside kinase